MLIIALNGMIHVKVMPSRENFGGEFNLQISMASLSSTNPHARGNQNSSISSDTTVTSAIRSSADEIWSKTAGDAVADNSKAILAVYFAGKAYIMADIRRLSGQLGLPKDAVALEFFFDGDLKEFGITDLLINMEGFFEALQLTVRNGVKEYFRRKIGQIADQPFRRSELKSLKFPNDTVSYIGSHISDAYRDAGCMLNFIAVRVYMSEACSECIGGLAFPEYFGMMDKKPHDPPIPKWLMGMAVTACLFAVAMVYAWAQILVYGNSLS